MLAEADELIILANNLRGSLGEVQSEGGLIGSEIIDIEYKLLRKVLRGSPDNPAYTWVDKTVPFTN
jgi:hypothetical protein